MIFVTGAAGSLGSRVVENLLRHVSAQEIRAGVRKPEEAGPLSARGVDVWLGSYEDPESLALAFAGADRLLLISASGIDHERRSTLHRNVIDAAVRSRVGHIYYTSLLPGEDSVAYVMKAHIDTERYLKGSGLPFTILRNSAYAEGWDLYLGESGAVAVPADGPISWVSKADLAEGTAKLLVEGGHQDETLNLTGPAALTLQGAAKLQHRAFRIVPVEEYVAGAEDKGRAEKWASTYDGLAQGEWAKVDPLLGELLGRPRLRMEEVLAKTTAGRVG